LSRVADITEKLAFADARYQELCTALFDAGRAGEPVQFVRSLAGQVLAASREALDYVALDIVETQVAPIDMRTQQALQTGKLRAYYPFYINQLEDRRSPYKVLEGSDEVLYEYLCHVATSASSRENYPDTRFNYGDLVDMANMVNTNKHDSLLAVDGGGGPMAFVDAPRAKLMIPTDNQHGISYIELSPDSTHNMGTQYVFEENRREIMNFTMCCKNLTRIIVEDIIAIMELDPAG
jgi:hypothetical protein